MTVTQPDHASVRSPAAIIGVVVAIVVGLSAWFLLDAGLRRSAPALEEATRTGAATVGQAVAGQFSHALQLGIPLDKLPGIEPYLHRIADSSPQVQGLAIIDAAGKTVAATAEGVTGESFPIAGDGTSATLVVAGESPLIDQAVRQVRIALTIAAVLCGAVAGGILGGFFAFNLAPAHARLLGDMERVASGDFTPQAHDEDRGPIYAASRALARSIDRVKAARRNLVEAVATIRAIDFDGSLGRRVDAILKPIDSRYAFADDRDGLDVAAPRGSGAVWRVAVLLCVYAAAFPYVANFAIDRESAVVPTAWLPVMPLLAELGAALAGALAGRSRAGHSSALLALAGLLLAAALGGTYWCRTYDVFVMLRAAAGVCAGFIVAALLVHRPVEQSRRGLAVLLIFAALFAAPLVSGLYAEAIGRRSGFMMLGIAALLIAPFVAYGEARTDRTPPRPTIAAATLPDILLALATAPAAAMVLVVLPAGIGFDNYLLGSGAAALLALAALIAPALPPLGCGAALLIGAAALHDPLGNAVASTLVACAALGLGGGAAVKSCVGEARHPWFSIGCAAALGLALTGATSEAGLTLALAVTIVALLVAAGQFLGRRPAEPAAA
ncbi:hypothetical protein RB623_15705 [Mesorhizobium sp. LHD-90]|uniref:hypothetical protein n=1 Tax=Mesorhizobium sp. LHD-90 TaxID=3071414 RepID=UPI0027DEF525|nr:hypothetical protein [Mesorhizobium sp. LHD-90]MDQ6435503.1 hypothetical protein [Mesorhizobium sp. LHD-90]